MAMNRKQFLMVALLVWVLVGFFQQAPVNQSVLEDNYNGNFTKYIIEETKTVGAEFLDIVFSGFKGMTTWLQDHILYVSLGIGILLIGFIGFKR